MRIMPFDVSAARNNFVDIHSGPGCGIVLHFPSSNRRLTLSLTPSLLNYYVPMCKIRFDSDPGIYPIISNPTKIIRDFKQIWLSNRIVTEQAEDYLYAYILENQKEMINFNKVNNFYNCNLISVNVNAAAEVSYYVENYAGIIDRVCLIATVDDVNNTIQILDGDNILLEFTGQLQYNENDITLGRFTHLKFCNAAAGPINFTDVQLFLRGIE